MITPEETILICATRYAMGRMSYVVGEVVDYIHHRKPRLSRACKDVLIRDITEELKRYHDAGHMMGHELDDKLWCDLLEDLKNDKRANKPSILSE